MHTPNELVLRALPDPESDVDAPPAAESTPGKDTTVVQEAPPPLEKKVTVPFDPLAPFGRDKGKRIIKLCGINGCQYKTGVSTNMRGHKHSIHKIPKELVPENARLKGDRDKYGIIKTCNVDGCGYRSGHSQSMKNHKAGKHGINVVWFNCEEPGCEYRAKRADSLKQHKQQKHDINVQWHYCKVDGCLYKAKRSGNLKQHKQDIHNLDVVWHPCEIEGCTYRAKKRGHLKRHLKHRHKMDSEPGSPGPIPKPPIVINPSYSIRHSNYKPPPVAPVAPVAP
eukprot:CAMPEP_0182509484 /NCGR_PEP_ID=MMETSP1321-20130603/26924_1 /TAXON_ID=91990 /ORGANISM="Bolidomonas sp., Strain RCC1657" /LENGTH=280 /DNA_ID=CAMNT_0024715765 /DNA_START=120 /DNA_END=958 /DNA_ORIENTATION=+